MMSSKVEILEELSEYGISCGIKNDLIKTVQKRLNSDNFKIQIEHGSKKGTIETVSK